MAAVAMLSREVAEAAVAAHKFLQPWLEDLLAKVRKLVGRDPQAFTPWLEGYHGARWFTWALFNDFLKFVPLRRSENFNYPALEGAQWAFSGCFQIFVPFFPPVLSKSEAQKGTNFSNIAENAH